MKQALSHIPKPLVLLSAALMLALVVLLPGSINQTPTIHATNGNGGCADFDGSGNLNKVDSVIFLGAFDAATTALDGIFAAPGDPLPVKTILAATTAGNGAWNVGVADAIFNFGPLPLDVAAILALTGGSVDLSPLDTDGDGFVRADDEIPIVDINNLDFDEDFDVDADDVTGVLTAVGTAQAGFPSPAGTPPNCVPVDSAGDPAPKLPPPPLVSLDAKSGLQDCVDAAGDPAVKPVKCTAEVGIPFTMAVAVNSLPAFSLVCINPDCSPDAAGDTTTLGAPGYVAFGATVSYSGDIAYKPQGVCLPNFVGPDNLVTCETDPALAASAPANIFNVEVKWGDVVGPTILRDPEVFPAKNGIIDYSMTSGLPLSFGLPNEISTQTGNLINLQFTCQTIGGTGTLAFVVKVDPVTPNIEIPGFVVNEDFDGLVGNPVSIPAKTTGPVTINCVEAPEPVPVGGLAVDLGGSSGIGAGLLAIIAAAALAATVALAGGATYARRRWL